MRCVSVRVVPSLHSSPIDLQHTDGASEELKGEFLLKSNISLLLSVQKQRFKFPQNLSLHLISL